MKTFHPSFASLQSRSQPQFTSPSSERSNLTSNQMTVLSQSLSETVRSRSATRRRSSDPGNRLSQARSLGWLSGSQTLSNTVGGRDRADVYAFSLEHSSNFNLSLSRLKNNANVQLFDQQRQVIAQSNRRANATETISAPLSSGIYYVRVHAQGDKTQYRLVLAAIPQSTPAPASAPVTAPATTPAPTIPVASTSVPSTPVPAEWTLMVYMAGDSLERYGIQDFLEMSAIGSRANVNVVVQFDRTAAKNLISLSDDDVQFGNWTDTRRGLVRAGETPGLNWGTSLGEVDMGQASTLRDFATWSMTNHPARNYGLVLWGHGDGVEVSLDDVSQDGISSAELSSVLSTLPDKIDLVGADACLMGMTEFAYGIRNGTDVFVGSQELEPRQGWHYTSFLQDLVNTPTMTAAQLGSTMVTRYGQHYAAITNGIEETLSAINLLALRETTPNNLTTALNNFAATMLSSGTGSDVYWTNWHRDLLSDWFGQDTLGIDRRFVDYFDLGNFFTRIYSDWNISWPVWNAASGVLTAYSAAIINNYSSVPNRATGLSIYISNWGSPPSASFSSNSQSFAANTLWDDWLSSSGWGNRLV